MENNPSDKFRIMVVDDSRMTIKFISAGFQHRDDFDLFTFNNVAKALNNLQNIKPDMIISDYDMPNLTGFDFCSLSGVIGIMPKFLSLYYQQQLMIIFVLNLCRSV